jgi:hypothetical protein
MLDEEDACLEVYNELLHSSNARIHQKAESERSLAMRGFERKAMRKGQDRLAPIRNSR